MYNEHECVHPQKLNRENFEDWPSAKIGPHEISRYTVCAGMYMYMHVLRKYSIASKETDLHNSMLLYLYTHEADLDTGLLRLGPSIQALGNNTSNYVSTNPKKIQ